MKPFYGTTVLARLCCIFWLSLMLVSGCTPAQLHDSDWILATANSRITLVEYRDAYEMAKAAYSHNILQEQRIQRALHYRVLKDLAESLVLEAGARQEGIVIDEARLKAAVEEMRMTFPEDELERMLSESAISERAWEEGLRRRLLTEKLVEKILDRELEVTPEALRPFFLEYSKTLGQKPEEVVMTEEVTEELIARFRRQEAEPVYRKWLQGVKEQVEVQVHTELLYRVFPETRPLLAELGEEEGDVSLPVNPAPDVDLHEEAGL
ncbi:SurA N-terminal domain-containing protein [Desulfobotulus sp. H1]|uniref:SurA N-terminal domain-containing protein n=1 Tax=Desulfobotulus pelophilus TaxID=2823377 RepID=A0ABT3NB17_9BACT|nr:SurA N-terminal domain-containing protein [Desulfobotulus pelophilus]MCW7754660.1 SurA N-terminal domain-containing protein [Desulfobotulus pelophilus]